MNGSVNGDSNLLHRAEEIAMSRDMPALAQFLRRAELSLHHMEREGKPINESRHGMVYHAHMVAMELESLARNELTRPTLRHPVEWERCANCAQPIYMAGGTWLHQDDLPVCRGAVVYRAHPMWCSERMTSGAGFTVHTGQCRQGTDGGYGPSIGGYRDTTSQRAIGRAQCHA